MKDSLLPIAFLLFSLGTIAAGIRHLRSYRQQGMVIAFLNIACPLLMAPLFWESAIGVEAKIVGFGLQASGAILSAIAFAIILRQKRLSNG